MKLRNRNQKWSEQDVWVLTRLMRERVPHATIAAILGRTEAGLRHAIKNTLYQQLLHHMPSDILTYYHMDNEELYKEVVKPVYYQELSEVSHSNNKDINEEDRNVGDSKDEEDDMSEPDTNNKKYEEESDYDSDEEQENTDSNNEQDTTEDSIEDTSKASDACDYIITSVMTLLVGAGIAVYVQLVKEHWN